MKGCEYFMHDKCRHDFFTTLLWKTKGDNTINAKRLCKDHTKLVSAHIKHLVPRYEFVKQVEIIGVEL